MKNLLASALTASVLLISSAFPAAAAPESRERHPEIHEAIHALEKAKAHLEASKHDFHGHRKEALEACENAIRQLHLALESDR
jgi:hypothetical protein